VSGFREVDWGEAECAGAPLSLFFILEEDKRVIAMMGTEPVRRICGACPIWRACLSYAMKHEDYGMWGGLLTKERQALKQKEGSALKEKAIYELVKYGISRIEIEEIANEYSDYERSLANKLTDNRENDSPSNRRPRYR
jgi:hypothetical protein